MFFLSFFIFLGTLILGFWFGNSLGLFTDLTFPTILLLVLLPSITFTIYANSLSAIKQSFADLNSGGKSLIAQKVLKCFGNTSLLIGIAVTLLNILSIAFNWGTPVTPAYLAAAFSTALLSSFIGLVIKICCVVGFYKAQG